MLHHPVIDRMSTAIVLIGNIGSGKTTLANFIIDNLSTEFNNSGRKFHKIAIGDYPKKVLSSVSKLFDKPIIISLIDEL